MEIVATTSFASSRPPERRPLERHKLVPKMRKQGYIFSKSARFFCPGHLLLAQLCKVIFIKFLSYNFQINTHFQQISRLCPPLRPGIIGQYIPLRKNLVNVPNEGGRGSGKTQEVPNSAWEEFLHGSPPPQYKLQRAQTIRNLRK